MHEPSDKVVTRNRSVLDAALAMAVRVGYRTMTRQDVAALAGVAVGSVNNAYGTMDGLRDAVMQAAVDHGVASVVAQGLADKHPIACGAPQPLKDAALASLAA